MAEKEEVSKERITHFFLSLLQIARQDIASSDDFEEALRKRLKFQKKTDYIKFRASVDLIDDTEYAIMSAFEYQLGYLGRRHKDIGEMNLRLYGILNAVYLQMNAYEEIAKLLNYPFRDTISKEFKELDIYKLRGIAGSHTVGYLYDKDILSKNPNIGKTTSFRIIQMHLEETGSNIVVLDENNISFEFSLLECLQEYERKATNLLIELIKHYISTLVYDKQVKKELKESLNDLVPRIIDYSKMNKNEKYEANRYKRLDRLMKKFRKETDSLND